MCLQEEIFSNLCLQNCKFSLFSINTLKYDFKISLKIQCCFNRFLDIMILIPVQGTCPFSLEALDILFFFDVLIFTVICPDVDLFNYFSFLARWSHCIWGHASSFTISCFPLKYLSWKIIVLFFYFFFCIFMSLCPPTAFWDNFSIC